MLDFTASQISPLFIFVRDRGLMNRERLLMPEITIGDWLIDMEEQRYRIITSVADNSLTITSWYYLAFCFVIH